MFEVLVRSWSFRFFSPSAARQEKSQLQRRFPPAFFVQVPRTCLGQVVEANQTQELSSLAFDNGHLKSAKRPAHHEQRCQNSSASARAKRNGPDEPLHEQNTKKDMRRRSNAAARVPQRRPAPNRKS
jgi:hypothetical protein